MYAGFPIQPLPARRTGKDCKIEIGAMGDIASISILLFTTHMLQCCATTIPTL